MTISLNGVTLDDDLYWEEEYSNTAAAQKILRTVLGNIIIQTMPIISGQVIYLVAKREGEGYVGFFTRAQIEGFKALEASALPVTFVFGSETHTVIVKAGGVQMEPLFSFITKSSSDKYIGVLTLIKV
jgi:hypothetical protein